MDLNANRGGRPTQPNASNQSGQQGNPANPVANPAAPKSNSDLFSSSGKKPSETSKRKFLNMKFASIALLFSATILVIALITYMVIGGPNKNEARYVEDDAYQAVFLNGGQVYFGKTTDLNNKFLRLVDIYYLRVNQQVQPTEEGQLPQGDDISLVKLGCELHGPQDEMLINREQVVFWENLKGDGDVTEAIATYREENPDGQDCDTSQEAGAAGAGQQQTAPTGTDAPNDTGASANDEDLNLE